MFTYKTKQKIKMKTEEIIDYYYNPTLKCTCGAIFDDTHRAYCHRRQRPKNKLKSQKLK